MSPAVGTVARHAGALHSGALHAGARHVKLATRVVYVSPPRELVAQVVEAADSRPAEEAPFFLLNQLVESIQPEQAWSQREDIIERISIAATLDQADEFTARTIVGWAEDLTQVLGTSTAAKLVPLFSEMFASKALRSMYSERRLSYMMQRQASRHAASHLMDSINALATHVDEATPTSASTVGGITGLAQRLELRYSSQIRELDADTFRATAFLKEIDGEGPERGIEVATAASEAELKGKLDGLLDDLRHESLQLMLRERVRSEAMEAMLQPGMPEA